MASKQVSKQGTKPTPLRPAETVEGRENQLVALAVNLAEQQLRDGTASSQVITHYLKLGTTREQLEQEKLRSENRLSERKIEALESAQRIEALYAEALTAMRSYQGQQPQEDDYDED